MLTTIMLVLLGIVALAVLAWWVFDVDMEFVAPVVTPSAGALLIYWHGSLIAWIVGIGLVGVGALTTYLVFRRRTRDDPRVQQKK